MKKRITLIVSLVLVMSIGVYAGVTWYQIAHPEDLFRIPPQEDEGKATTQPSNSASPNDQVEPTEEPYQFKESMLNLLLMGLDADEGRYKTMGAFRTDTMILVSIDFTENTVDMISIPRDSYVKIPGRKERGRVNAAFVYGGGLKKDGFTTTIQTVQDLFGGIPIHYYAAIDMNAFIKIIDGFGGITYEVDVPVSSAGLDRGIQKLNGVQTLAYARHRKTAGGDIDRVNRQQRLLMGILDQLKSTDSIVKLPGVYDSVKDDIWTNLNFKQVAALALFANNMDMDHLQRHMVPGNYLDMDKISYWGIDQKKKNQLINELFGLNITTYDKEDDIHFVKEQLRKRHEEFKKMAQTWIDRGSKFLAKYGSVIMEDERIKVDSGVMILKDELANSELDDIETIVFELEEELAKLQLVVDQRKPVLDGGTAVLSRVKEELLSRNPKLKEEEKEPLNAKITLLQQAITSKRFDDIPRAAEELSKHWDSLKKVLDDRPIATPTPAVTTEPTPEPTKTPEGEPTPTPEALPTSSPTTVPSPTPTTTPEPTSKIGPDPIAKDVP